MWTVQHHDASATFDWVTIAVVLAVALLVAGLGWLLWLLVRRRRYGEE